MALTERYVRADAAGGGDGTTDANSGANGAFTWAEMITDLNTPRVGYRYNVKAGTYSLSATTTLTGDGTAASPNIIRGFNATPGDLDTQGRTSGNGALDTTNYPAISYGAIYYFNGSGADHLWLQNLNFSGSRNGALVSLGASGVAYQCKVVNSASNAATAGIYVTAATTIVQRCDVDVTAATVLAAITCEGVASSFIDVRILDSSGDGIRTTSSAGGDMLIAFCVFGADVDGDCISMQGGIAHRFPRIFCCTAYGGGDFFTCNSCAHTGRVLLVGNHVTDMGGYLMDSAYNTTANLAAWLTHNRTRDNTNATRGFTDCVAASSLSHVTTDTGAAETDYTNAGSSDLTLISAAPAKGVSFLPYLDIGALQRQEAASSGGSSPRVGDRTGGLR